MPAKTAAERMAEKLAAEAAADPLRDLRDDDATDLPGTAHDGAEAPPEAPEPLIVDGLVTVEAQERARHVLVAAWHADPTTLGFLHKGETCGCWYLSGVSVRAILPIQANTDDAGE